MFKFLTRVLSKPSPAIDDKFVLVFTPSLASGLSAAETQRSRALTEGEVLVIRDTATCIAVRNHVAIEMERKRGYPEIVAGTAGEDWHALRVER